MNFQTAFQNMMQAIKNDSEDASLPTDVRYYAKTFFMVMQAHNSLIEYQEQEAVEELIEFFEQH